MAEDSGRVEILRKAITEEWGVLFAGGEMPEQTELAEAGSGKSEPKMTLSIAELRLTMQNGAGCSD
jgi:hypothetical protein